jgi:hypothetical protein
MNTTRLRIVAILVLVLATEAGCGSNQNAQRKEFDEKCRNVYQGYLHGGRNEARQSLLELIPMIENSNLPPDTKAPLLYLQFARLYALERRAGSNDLAQVALIKARYWRLRTAELDRHTPAEAVAEVERTAAEDKLMAGIDKWDKDSNGGKSPSYIQQP